MRFDRDAQVPRGRRRDAPAAFTLIELLVSVAVIAALLAILLPALGGARQAARAAICMSNQRQLGIAWAAYMDDFKVFPVPAVTGNALINWGGVDWYASTGGTPAGVMLSASRPINPYVSPSDTIEFRANLFKCPLDIGCRYWVSEVRDWEQLGATSTSGEVQTIFGVAGNSYLSNGWIYCKPGATTGFGTPGSSRPRQGPHLVQVSPSRFVLLMDTGPANWVVSTVAHREQDDLWGDWWHGKENEMMCFLDGSVRLEKTGLVVCERYSMHMMPVEPSVANAGWIWPTHR